MGIETERKREVDRQIVDKLEIRTDKNAYYLIQLTTVITLYF